VYSSKCNDGLVDFEKDESEFGVNMQPIAKKVKGGTDCYENKFRDTPNVPPDFDPTPVLRKRVRCNNCLCCRLPDCGECPSCLDKIKFGGSAFKSSLRSCLQRKCKQVSQK